MTGVHRGTFLSWSRGGRQPGHPDVYLGPRPGEVRGPHPKVCLQGLEPLGVKGGSGFPRGPPHAAPQAGPGPEVLRGVCCWPQRCLSQGIWDLLRGPKGVCSQRSKAVQGGWVKRLGPSPAGPVHKLSPVKFPAGQVVELEERPGCLSSASEHCLSPLHGGWEPPILLAAKRSCVGFRAAWAECHDGRGGHTPAPRLLGPPDLPEPGPCRRAGCWAGVPPMAGRVPRRVPLEGAVLPLLPGGP